MFSVVSIARNQRRERICSVFSIDTESSKLRVAGSSPAAPTILQQLRATEHFTVTRITRLSPPSRPFICTAFLDVLRSSGIRPLALPPRSPNLNAFSERWVCSLRQECLSKLILFGETSLRRALNEYIEHHHFERNHQGKGNLLLFPSPDVPLSPKSRTVRCPRPTRGLAKVLLASRLII